MSIARPKIVSPFEDKLVKIARAIVGQLPVDQALPHIAERNTRPASLSQAALDLVQETLIHGCALYLARAGGWRRERLLRDGKPCEGRLWERTAPSEMPLEFSRHTMNWLIWLTAGRPEDLQSPLNPAEAQITPADRFLIHLTYAALRDSEFATALRVRPEIAGHGLVRL